VSEKVWKILSSDTNIGRELADACGLSLLAANVLSARGYTRESADMLVRAEKYTLLHDPLLMKDMDKAVLTVSEAVENGEMICVFGDYDCDGVAATVMLHDYLSQIGARVCYYIPHREKEGYGLNKKAILELYNYGVDLIVTVDNGVSAIDEIAYANELGMRVVVTDHHQPRPELPDACAVVDPHRADDKYPFPEICGAGVAFKLICAMEGENGYGALEEYGDLLAIGTVADVVDLKDENRIFVRRGLEIMSESPRTGIFELLKAAGLEGKNLSSESVAFGIAPRINAVGRIESAETAAMLLLTESSSEACELAAVLDSCNQSRRVMEKTIVDDIAAMLERDPSITGKRLIIIDGSGWNAGVVGIVCSRLVERFNKPCIIIAKEGDNAKGSGRSVDGFSLIDAVSSCADILTRYGGHPMAAGFSLNSFDVPEFRRRIEEYAAKNHYEMPPVTLKVDCAVSPENLTVDEVRGLSVLEPFGCGNEPPVFAVLDARIERVVALSEGKHSKIRLSKNGMFFDALFFSVSPRQLGFEAGDRVDVAFSVGLNEFRGEISVSLKAKGICAAGEDTYALHREKQLYERCTRGECKGIDLVPTRDETALVYRYIRALNEAPFAPDVLYRNFKRQSDMSYARFRLAIDILTELGVFIKTPNAIAVAPSGTKVDLNSSAIVRRLSNNE